MDILKSKQFNALAPHLPILFVQNLTQVLTAYSPTQTILFDFTKHYTYYKKPAPVSSLKAKKQTKFQKREIFINKSHTYIINVPVFKSYYPLIQQLGKILTTASTDVIFLSNPSHLMKSLKPF
jgi:hypothetical protein